MNITKLENQEKWRNIAEWAAAGGKTLLVTPGLDITPLGRVYLHDMESDSISGIFANNLYHMMAREGWPTPGDKAWNLPPEKWGV